MSVTCGPRSTGRSGAGRWRPCGEPDTGSGTTMPRPEAGPPRPPAVTVSLRSRLTLAFATAMALVLAGLGGFIYLRLGSELLGGIDRSLGTRADALSAALATDGSAPLGGGHRFADPDEAFVQVLDRSGRILQATSAVSGSALL